MVTSYSIILPIVGVPALVMEMLSCNELATLWIIILPIMRHTKYILEHVHNVASYLSAFFVMLYILCDHD